MEMDPKALAEHFDRLTHQHESGDRSDGRRQVDLLKKANSIRPTGLYRRMDLVDKGLVATFREIVTGQAPWPLFLHGSVGSGKTRAALALADFVPLSRYWTLEDLCTSVMDTEVKDAQMWGHIRDNRLTILDELGERVKSGDLLYTTLKHHLDLREQHAGSVGIYISNLPPEAIGELFDKRIESRLTAGTVFELSGPDRRKRTREKS